MSDDERLGLPSASEIYRLDNCSGSKILIESLRAKGIVLDFQNLYASLGERIHASLAGEPEVLDRKAQEVRDDCDKLSDIAAFEFTGGMSDLQDECDILYEERFWYELSGTKFFSGKPDKVYVHKSRILDANFKTGRGEEEEAHLNLQLRSEVVLLHHHFPNVPEIGVSIIQPLVTHSPEIAVYGKKEMAQAEAEILQIVDRAAWNPERTAGVWCKYCPARAFCPEAREMAIEFPLTVNVDLLPEGPPATEMMNLLNVAYDVLDALWDAFSKKIAADPESVPGWHISAGKKVRSLPKEKEYEFTECADNEGISVTDAMKFSITAFEDIAARTWGLKGKAFKAKFEKEFGQFFAIRHDAGYLEKIPKSMLNRIKDSAQSG